MVASIGQRPSKAIFVKFEICSVKIFFSSQFVMFEFCSVRILFSQNFVLFLVCYVRNFFCSKFFSKLFIFEVMKAPLTSTPRDISNASTKMESTIFLQTFFYLTFVIMGLDSILFTILMYYQRSNTERLLRGGRGELGKRPLDFYVISVNRDETCQYFKHEKRPVYVFIDVLENFTLLKRL